MTGLDKELEVGLHQDQERYNDMADTVIDIKRCGSDTLRGIHKGSRKRYAIPGHTVKRQCSFGVIHNRPTHRPYKKFKSFNGPWTPSGVSTSSGKQY